MMMDLSLRMLTNDLSYPVTSLEPQAAVTPDGVTATADLSVRGVPVWCRALSADELDTIPDALPEHILLIGVRQDGLAFSRPDSDAVIKLIRQKARWDHEFMAALERMRSGDVQMCARYPESAP